MQRHDIGLGEQLVERADRADARPDTTRPRQRHHVGPIARARGTRWAIFRTRRRSQAASGQGLPTSAQPGHSAAVTQKAIELDLTTRGWPKPPRPQHPSDEVQQVPYRPVRFRDDDLPAALERSAAWLRGAQQWLGEPLHVIAITSTTTTARARRTTR